MAIEEIVKSNADYVVTESVLDPSSVQGCAFVSKAREDKTTGRLTIDLADGGIRRVELTEKTKAAPGTRKKLRTVVGV
jgi:hypothetical protein